ncbi:hypothetical protein [Aliiroseovarius sp.]|uniref:hypothetical protein n=1 Tax=Aliiroseovarius sp. TaxID=1872442 RepID=UPI00262F988E|nr:hypothetical protein [Aliiroseovarius sp.]
MTAQLGTFQQGVTRVSDVARGPRVLQTHWGYTVIESDRARARGMALERGGKLLGAVCMLTAFGFWVLPGTVVGNDTLTMKLALSVSLLFSGLLLIWSARSGYNNEVQIDLARKEMRIGLRNIAGDYQVSAALDFAQIGSVYLMRSKKPGEPARLFLRVGNSDRAVEVADGRVEMLEPLRERLAHDISHAIRGEMLRKKLRRRPDGEIRQAEFA